jgi:hypothetical protein
MPTTSGLETVLPLAANAVVAMLTMKRSGRPTTSTVTGVMSVNVDICV